MYAKSAFGVAIAAMVLGLTAVPGAAASFDDPDWPCVQRKVPTLSLGQMWPGPPPEGTWHEDPAISRLAEVIAARRTTLEEVARLAADYAATLPAADRPGRMALLFAGVLDRIGAERGAVISGIGRYARKQADLAARIKTREAELVALEAAADPDLDAIEALRDTQNWDIRVFRERGQSLTYVCETPVLLEQRAFAIARILAGDG